MIKIDWESLKKKITKIDEKNKPPMGMRIYEAPQGHGKTLSMVHDAWALKRKYPKLYVISNIKLKFANEVIHGATALTEALKKTNGENGILLIIDEFQLFAGKKKGVPYEVFQGLCQQRKHRRFMMGTAQDWEDVDPSARKKVAEVVHCKRIFNLQVNQMFDGYTIKYNNKENGWECKPKGWTIFKHNDELYNSYDTYAEISTNDEFVESVQVSLPQAPAVEGRACGKLKKNCGKLVEN